VREAKPEHLLGFAEPVPDLRLLEGGGQAGERAPAGRSARQGRKQTKDDVELENFEIGVVLREESTGIACV
jgi:hypothetical protein